MMLVFLVPTASIAWGLILSGTIPICRMSSVVVCLSVKWALFLNRLRQKAHFWAKCFSQSKLQYPQTVFGSNAPFWGNTPKRGKTVKIIEVNEFLSQSVHIFRMDSPNQYQSPLEARFLIQGPNFFQKFFKNGQNFELFRYLSQGLIILVLHCLWAPNTISVEKIQFGAPVWALGAPELGSKVCAIAHKRLVRKSSSLVDGLPWVWGCAFWAFCEIRGTSEISPTPPQKTISALQLCKGSCVNPSHRPDWHLAKTRVTVPPCPS